MIRFGATTSAIAAALGFMWGGAAQANLVLNPNFDLNSPPSQTAPIDWTLTKAATGSDFFVGSGQTFGAFSPPNNANFGATGFLDDELDQILPTVAGNNYTVSFQYANDAGNTPLNGLSVFLGGKPCFSVVNDVSHGYVAESCTITNPGNNADLAFFGQNVSAWSEVDNVSVVGAPVPEPSTWAMMLLGFAGLGYAGYRRAKVVRTA
jgi:hypothetical protein